MAFFNCCSARKEGDEDEIRDVQSLNQIVDADAHSTTADKNRELPVEGGEDQIRVVNAVTAMPTAAVPPKIKRTYGKKASKLVPDVPEIFNSSNPPRDPLAEITESLSNIQIKVPGTTIEASSIKSKDLEDATNTPKPLEFPSVRSLRARDASGEKSPSPVSDAFRREVEKSKIYEDYSEDSESDQIPDNYHYSPSPSIVSLLEKVAIEKARANITPRIPKKSIEVKVPTVESPSKWIDPDQATSPIPKTPIRRVKHVVEPQRLLSPQAVTEIPEIPDWLQPLAVAYNNGPRTTTMNISTWNAILADIDTITKIAEASYAEVYRVSVASETSILKIITLKPPKGPGSKRCTAMAAKDVLSEFRIMDALAEVDGFLELKDAYLVKGKPTKEMAEAHDLFRETNSDNENYYFPHPTSYPKETMFFVLEMVDAGKDLGKFNIGGLVQVFDFFLQVSISLDAAERYFQFEHRDLHENNLCLRRRDRDPKKMETHATSRYKLHKSGYDVTILDFTLSRAQVPSTTPSSSGTDIAFFDLSADSGIFEGEGNVQYDVYRAMRSALTSASASNTPSWETSIPYTNVLWLAFVFNYLMTKYEEVSHTAVEVLRRSGGWKLEEFKKRLEEIVELREKLEGEFTCAGDVVEWALKEGWMEEGDRL